jgi:hypothetical protein
MALSSITEMRDRRTSFGTVSIIAGTRFGRVT